MAGLLPSSSVAQTGRPPGGSGNSGSEFRGGFHPCRRLGNTAGWRTARSCPLPSFVKRSAPMPIASPEVYAEMLDRAKAGAFAYPAINVTSSQTLNAALQGFTEAG